MDGIVILGVLGTCVAAGIAALSFWYAVIRDTKTGGSKNIKVTASLGSYSANIPDPGPNRVSLRVGVFWEIWAKQDVTFDKLALNLIHVYDKHWWQFWEKTKFPKTGIPPIGQHSTSYRQRVKASDPQPFRDDAEFEYVGDSDDASPHWLLELVLIAGMPAGEYRIPVFIDWDEINKRGTNPPL